LRIFLSHSHQDNDWCSAFVEELTQYGADVWYDQQSLYVGAKWRQIIEIELEGRDIFLLVLTPHSWASDWVQDELTLAMNHQKRIVSILHQPMEVKGFITTRQMLQVVGLSSAEAARLVAAALGLARVEQASKSLPAAAPTPSEVVDEQPSGEPYDYFEITMDQISLGAEGAPPFPFYYFQVTNTHTGKALYKLGSVLLRPPKSVGKHPAVAHLRQYAKLHELEELPEKGKQWYSYRFRREKQ
jgi:hypothetical protein